MSDVRPKVANFVPATMILALGRVKLADPGKNQAKCGAAFH